MHVAQLGFFLDPQKRAPEQLLSDWPSLVDIAEAAAHDGVRVSVVQASATARHIESKSIVYHFLVPDAVTGSIADTPEFLELMEELAPDVFHVHGFGFAGDVLALARMPLRRPILLQDHKDRVPRFWRRGPCRRSFAEASALAFTGREQCQRFVDAGLVRDGTRVFDIPESTSRFTPGDRAEARRLTGLDGDPCLLWVGHLNENKDPLTVLEAVSQSVEAFPGIRLWCCFGTAPLRREVEKRIAGDPRLQDRVKLLGAVPHAGVETLMRAADVFVLGSLHEGSGYSLIEASACGLPAVITDIPPFRALVGDCGAAELWKRGDAASMRQALERLCARPRDRLREAARAHFDRELSFAALGRKWRAAYAELGAANGHA